jgi:DNA-binding beta-propeller fold protein YncE
MKFLVNGFLMALIGLIGYSCKKNDNNPGVQEAAFKHGVFVVNEGNYSDADGEVSFIDYSTGAVGHKIFESVNGRPFAGLLQSFTLSNGKGYLVDQLGRIEAVNSISFKSEGSITENLSIPRYMTIDGTTAFVSDWGPYDAQYKNNESKIVIIDLNTLTITNKFSTASRPEGVYLVSTHLFVANSATNKISVYNSGSHSLEKEIEVTVGPSAFVMDKYGNLWTSCTGNDSINSALVNIDVATMQVKTKVSIPLGIHLNGRIAIDSAKSNLYIMSEAWSSDFSYTSNVVFRQPVDDQSFKFRSILSGKNLYGLGVDPSGNYLFIANAEGFQANGLVFIYNENGALLDSVAVDRGPRDFVYVK